MEGKKWGLYLTIEIHEFDRFKKFLSRFAIL
jgi:hypothetical protein